MRSRTCASELPQDYKSDTLPLDYRATRNSSHSSIISSRLVVAVVVVVFVVVVVVVVVVALIYRATYAVHQSSGKRSRV